MAVVFEELGAWLIVVKNGVPLRFIFFVAAHGVVAFVVLG